jgi:hypothetical protein
VTNIKAVWEPVADNFVMVDVETVPVGNAVRIASP